MKRSIHLFTAMLLVVLTAGVAHALPVIVPDFAVDPSNGQFTIQAVSASDPGSVNIEFPPELEFGVTSEPDGTLNTMKMSWDADEEGSEAQAGWELVFGADPDLTNLQIILSISPPGGWTDAAGTTIASPGNPGIGDLFQGIRSLEVRAVDNLNAFSGWGFNTDEDLLFGPPVNDAAAANLHSLANNVMQTVTINVGLGPVAGSASVAGVLGGPFVGPNFITSGGGGANFVNIVKLQFFENGILQGGVAVIPGQTVGGLQNYWDHITITPEPATLGLMVLGSVALLRRRRAG